MGRPSASPPHASCPGPLPLVWKVLGETSAWSNEGIQLTGGRGAFLRLEGALPTDSAAPFAAAWGHSASPSSLPGRTHFRFPRLERDVTTAAAAADVLGRGGSCTRGVSLPVSEPLRPEVGWGVGGFLDRGTCFLVPVSGLWAGKVAMLSRWKWEEVPLGGKAPFPALDWALVPSPDHHFYDESKAFHLPGWLCQYPL